MDAPASTILVFCEDLLLAPSFEDVGRRLGFTVHVIDQADAIGAQGAFEPRPIPLTEPVRGPDADFMWYIVDRQPALILMDTGAKRIPWERWMQTLKTSAATRRIPLVAFGPHVETQSLARARTAGADAVISRGGMLQSLDQLIGKWARTTDLEAVLIGCDGELSVEARQGMELIRQGEYYLAHEALENAWNQANESEGTLYRSLLQVAVAYHHVSQGNFAGAVKMLMRVRQWLAPLPAVCRGIDTVALRAGLSSLEERLRAVGQAGIAEIDRALLKPVPMAQPG